MDQVATVYNPGTPYESYTGISPVIQAYASGGQGPYTYLWEVTYDYPWSGSGGYLNPYSSSSERVQKGCMPGLPETFKGRCKVTDALGAWTYTEEFTWVLHYP